MGLAVRLARVTTGNVEADKVARLAEKAASATINRRWRPCRLASQEPHAPRWVMACPSAARSRAEIVRHRCDTTPSCNRPGRTVLGSGSDVCLLWRQRAAPARAALAAGLYEVDSSAVPPGA